MIRTPLQALKGKPSSGMVLNISRVLVLLQTEEMAETAFFPEAEVEATQLPVDMADLNQNHAILKIITGGHPE